MKKFKDCNEVHNLADQTAIKALDKYPIKQVMGMFESLQESYAEKPYYFDARAQYGHEINKAAD